MTESLKATLIEMLTQVGMTGIRCKNTMLWVQASNVQDKIRSL